MDRAEFFNSLRDDRRVFGSSLSSAEVTGTESILDACIANGVDQIDHVAFILANVYRETGGYMLPIKETVMPSHDDKMPSDAVVIARLERAWKAGRLPWVKTPYWRDGGFGRGQIQLSLWPGYVRAGKLLGLPLRENPDLALRLDVSARIAVIGMRDGWFTGRKLSDYRFPEALGFLPKQHPRRIVNGVDGSDKEINRSHAAFLDALKAGGWGKASISKPDPLPQPGPVDPFPDAPEPPTIDAPAISALGWLKYAGIAAAMIFVLFIIFGGKG